MEKGKLRTNMLIDELAEMRTELRKISMIVENRLIGLEQPTRNDIQSIMKFESLKSSGKLKLIPLKEIK